MRQIPGTHSHERMHTQCVDDKIQNESTVERGFKTQHQRKEKKQKEKKSANMRVRGRKASK